MVSLENTTKYVFKLTLILHNLFHEVKEERTLSNLFDGASVILIPKSDKDSSIYIFFKKTKNYRPIYLMHLDAKVVNRILAT